MLSKKLLKLVSSLAVTFTRIINKAYGPVITYLNNGKWANACIVAIVIALIIESFRVSTMVGMLILALKLMAIAIVLDIIIYVIFRKRSHVVIVVHPRGK